MLHRSRAIASLLLVLLTAAPAGADDKDFLRPVGEKVPPNLLIVFGNSQTLSQTISFTGVNTSTFDGDGDSPGSKMGSAKRVIKDFVLENSSAYNIGLTSFGHDPNAGSIDIDRKHWVYQALDVDFPGDSFAEPVGTLSRWGPAGEGPCTTKTVPVCTDRSKQADGVTPAVIQLDSTDTIVGPFFGPSGTGTAYIYLDGTSASTATQRIRHTLYAGSKYGEAFTDASLATLTRGTHSIAVKKEFQQRATTADPWPVGATQTPTLQAGEVIVRYRPPASFPSDHFFTNTADPADPVVGDAVGFLSDPAGDFDVNANCSGWEFQTNSAQVPLVKIPRDYFWGEACNPPQNSVPCVKRMLRPQAYIERYDSVTGVFSTHDPDNPGYTTGVSADKYLDGCDSNLLGAVQAGLDVVENNTILTTLNGSQAPIKNLLENIYAYFTEPKHDDFKNGARLDDPNAICRSNAVILIYDNFNGCQNDNCTFLKNKILTPLKTMGIPVYVIGFGASAAATASTGVCIAQHSGALKLNGDPGYFPVTSDVELRAALLNIASLINESQKGFVASSVSTAQSSGEQVTFLSTFNATSNRSIWSGRVNAYKLDANGNLKMGLRKITDANDPFAGATVPAPSNAPDSLMWNAGRNLTDTPGTGATVPAAVLTPGAVPDTGEYEDTSNTATSTIATTFFPGRKIVFSLPQGYPTTDPAVLPLANSNAVPEIRRDMVYNPSEDWWPALRTLLTPQPASVPPFTVDPPIADSDAGDSLRFIWGDRDPIILALDPEAVSAKLYGDADDDRVTDGVGGLKLGDIFHSSPVLVGRPNDFPFFISNLNGYQNFLNTHRSRRRVLIVGANDGLLHAFDAGGWDRNRDLCELATDQVTRQHCYDLGTGAELFAYAPRSIMQIYKGLKDTHGPQTRRIQWSVDGPPTAGDVFIDSNHAGTPTSADRAWHTVLIGGMREGAPFEGLTGEEPRDTLGSYYALDITQPDALTTDATGNPVTVTPATVNAPACLNDSSAGGHASCAKAWPSVLWEITDVGDLDAGVAASPGDGFVDMAESWSKPSLGRVKVCTADCGTETAVIEDRYVAIFGGGFDRERLNRRGNWLYMVDVETGHVLYRANSSCGINAGTSCTTSTPTYFGSMPSEPAALDGNGDGTIDLVYIGDLKGRVWRVDLTDLRLLSSAPSGRFANKIDVDAGSGKPFLFFDAPQPTAPAAHPFYPVYYRPIVISLGFNVGGKPAVGIAFGSGDRDDITSSLEPIALAFNQRYYYVVDRNNNTTRTESDLLNIASPNAQGVSTAPEHGWLLQLPLGERINADAVAVGGVVFFPTFNPLAAQAGAGACANNSPECGLAQGTARLYRVFYSTGNPYLGNDRGQAQDLGGFLSEPVYFQSQDQQGNLMYTTENTVKKESAPGAKKTSIKSWKERSRRP